MVRVIKQLQPKIKTLSKVLHSSRNCVIKLVASDLLILWQCKLIRWNSNREGRRQLNRLFKLLRLCIIWKDDLYSWIRHLKDFRQMFTKVIIDLEEIWIEFLISKAYVGSSKNFFNEAIFRQSSYFKRKSPEKKKKMEQKMLKLFFREKKVNKK